MALRLPRLPGTGPFAKCSQSCKTCQPCGILPSRTLTNHDGMTSHAKKVDAVLGKDSGGGSAGRIR